MDIYGHRLLQWMPVCLYKKWSRCQFFCTLVVAKMGQQASKSPVKCSERRGRNIKNNGKMWGTHHETHFDSMPEFVDAILPKSNRSFNDTVINDLHQWGSCSPYSPQPPEPANLHIFTSQQPSSNTPGPKIATPARCSLFSIGSVSLKRRRSSWAKVKCQLHAMIFAASPIYRCFSQVIAVIGSSPLFEKLVSLKSYSNVPLSIHFQRPFFTISMVESEPSELFVCFFLHFWSMLCIHTVRFESKSQHEEHKDLHPQIATWIPTDPYCDWVLQEESRLCWNKMKSETSQCSKFAHILKHPIHLKWTKLNCTLQNTT